MDLIRFFSYFLIFFFHVFAAAEQSPSSCRKVLLVIPNEIEQRKIEFDRTQYEANVRKMAQNETLLQILRHLKKVSGGVMARKYAAPIAALVYDLPFTPEGWISSRQESNHFSRHGHEFGFKNKTEYTNAAIHFASRKSETALVLPYLLTQSEGGWAKFDPTTMEYLILTSDRKIVNYLKVTLFSPEKHFDHFLMQFFGFRSKNSVQ